MPLTAGTRLGSYEIVAPIGAGGMSACGRGAEPVEAPPRAGVGPREHFKKQTPSPCR